MQTYTEARATLLAACRGILLKKLADTRLAIGQEKDVWAILALGAREADLAQQIAHIDATVVEGRAV